MKTSRKEVEHFAFFQRGWSVVFGQTLLILFFFIFQQNGPKESVF